MLSRVSREGIDHRWPRDRPKTPARNRHGRSCGRWLTAFLTKAFAYVKHRHLPTWCQKRNNTATTDGPRVLDQIIKFKMAATLPGTLSTAPFSQPLQHALVHAEVPQVRSDEVGWEYAPCPRGSRMWKAPVLQVATPWTANPMAALTGS